MEKAHGDEQRGLRIGLFSVKYSPNLGDGMLSECLELELQRNLPRTTTVPLDLAGRMDYGDRGRFRSAALAVLELSPPFARQSVVEAVLGRSLRSRMRPYWRRMLAELDAVVVGGGNLFGDADLNFPLKIDGALAEARHAGLPTAVFGVGVSDNWTPRGSELFCRALAAVPLVYASVRDEQSRTIWNKRLCPAGIRPAITGHDPGLLVASHKPARRATTGAPPLVGIGITHPAVLRYHADEHSSSEADLTAWFGALARRCTARGWRVVMFTNGSPEDEAFLRRVGAAVAHDTPGGLVSIATRFNHPMDLAAFISGLDIVLAHRLHANIAAYSYGVPHVGFSWDRKLKSFFARVGRANFICRAAIDEPEQVAQLAGRAMDEGIDPVRHRKTLADAREGVADLASSLQAAASASGGPARSARAAIAR